MANKPKSQWPENTKEMVCHAVDGGLGGLIILGAIIIGVAWVLSSGMTSADRKEMILAILGWKIFGGAGWFFAIAEIFIFKAIYDSRDRTDKSEVDRMAKQRDRAVQTKLPFELQSSNPSLKEK